ncbi:MAG: M24 family metallopeptidase, partial [Chloroflexota bacterium]
GARMYVNAASSFGAATLLVTPSARHLITNNLEAERFEQEEKLQDQGWEFHVAPWYARDDTLARLTRGMRVGVDSPMPGALDLSDDLMRLRIMLTPEERERLRVLGRLCTEAIEATARAMQPGQTEQTISARLAYEAELRGVQAVINIVASDWRVGAFRHALPTAKPLEKYAMLVLNGRRWGLVCSVTRFVHFGKMPDGLRRASDAVAQIAATCLEATRPGKSLGEIFRLAVQTYAALGFADEWRIHHQGGAVGYEPREFFITSDSTETVIEGQAYVWNPSIGLARSVDTFLVGESENELLTASRSWPQLSVTAGHRAISRLAVLEVL